VIGELSDPCVAPEVAFEPKCRAARGEHDVPPALGGQTWVNRVAAGATVEFGGVDARRERAEMPSPELADRGCFRNLASWATGIARPSFGAA